MATFNPAGGGPTVSQCFYDVHDISALEGLSAAMLLLKSMLSQSKTYGANISCNLSFKYSVEEQLKM